MTWPLLPLVLRVKRGRWPNIWLPLVVLWPAVLFAFCIALPLCLVWPPPRRNPFAMLGAAYRTLCALHGAEFELGSGEETWTWSLY